MARSPSTLTSLAYNARTRLGFQILMALYENGLIEREKIPADALKMIATWTNMKKGRKHIYEESIAGQLLSLLDDVPASDSEELCPDHIARRLETWGEQLIIDSYVVIYPIGLTNEWSYRRTISGDHLLKVTQYS